MKYISLRELCGLVERTIGKKLPTARTLRESGAAVVASAKVGADGELTVYQSGFYTYRAAGCTTVYAVDRCAGYAYDGDEALDAAFFEDKEWTLRLMLAGEDRLEHNHNVREESSHFSFSGDVMEGRDLQDPYDFTADLESRDAVEQLLAVLTERQRQVVEMYFVDGLAQQQIADCLGIRKQVVCRHLQSAIERMITLFEK